MLAVSIFPSKLLFTIDIPLQSCYSLLIFPLKVVIHYWYSLLLWWKKIVHHLLVLFQSCLSLLPWNFSIFCTVISPRAIRPPDVSTFVTNKCFLKKKSKTVFALLIFARLIHDVVIILRVLSWCAFSLHGMKFNWVKDKVVLGSLYSLTSVSNKLFTWKKKKKTKVNWDR